MNNEFSIPLVIKKPDRLSGIYYLAKTHPEYEGDGITAKYLAVDEEGLLVCGAGMTRQGALDHAISQIRKIGEMEFTRQLAQAKKLQLG